MTGEIRHYRFDADDRRVLLKAIMDRIEHLTHLYWRPEREAPNPDRQELSNLRTLLERLSDSPPPVPRTRVD